jgi:hypothetical protein
LDLSLTIPGPMAARKCRGAIVLIEELFNQDRETLRAELGKLGCEPAADLSSIVLVGGKGTRLAESRKLIDPADYPQLDSSYYGQIGPKGMAIMEGVLGGESVRRPLTDWHLEIHAACPEVTGLTFALGAGGDIISMVPWELSGECGTADLDLESGLLSGFREKCPKENNPWVEIDGERFTPINSGHA